MKFLCDRCKTRYAIADERVRGKILKIRCKNCSAVITVREGMDETNEPTTASAPPPVLDTAPEPPAPAALDEEWYVSRDGNQEGPFTLTEAQAWISARAGDDELFCWNEGFDDWLPVEKVSHFRGLRGTPRSRPATRPGVAKEPEPQPLFAATLAAIEAEAAAATAATAAKLAPPGGGAVQVPAAKNPAPSQWRTPGPPTGDETLDMPVPDAAQVMAGARGAPRSQTPAVGVPAMPRAAAPAAAPALPRTGAAATPPPRTATPAIGVPAIPRAVAPAVAPALPRTATPAVGVPAIPRAAPATPVAGTPIAGASPPAAPAASPPAASPPAAGGMRLEPAAATPPPQRSGLPSPFGVSRTAPGVAAPQAVPHAAPQAVPHAAPQAVPHAAPQAAAAAPTPAAPVAPAAYTPPPSAAPAAYTPPPVAYATPSAAPAAYAAPGAMPAAPIAALTPAPVVAPAPAWSPPPPVASGRPPAARFDNGESNDEAAAEAIAAAQPAPAPSFGDDDLDIGEVSRVVKLADLGRAPAGRAAAKPRAPTAGIGRGTGAVSSFGASPTGAAAAAERAAGFGGDVAPALDPGVSIGAVPIARRRSPVLYIGLGLVAVAIAVVAVIVLSGGGEDTTGNETAGGNDYDNLGYRPNDPVGKRPGSNDPGAGTGSGPGTAVIKPDRGSSTGTGRRPGSSVVGTAVDAGTEGPDPGVNPALPDLSPDDVFAMSARMESGTRRCYERAMKADPFLKVSKIRATIKVSAAGPVSDVTLSTMAGTQLGTCLVAAIKRWPFKPSQTGIVSEFALVFEQK